MHILDPAVRGLVSGWRNGQLLRKIRRSSLTTSFLGELVLRISNGKDW
ncbi:hypothetical protein PspLS_08271 [Pyricularia sp. CBS 133598]|nr:hypothetical protein PspLS_08271 [Pyricularia sp. CBS 133598]